MDEWNEYAYPRITAMAMDDSLYRELADENKQLEPEYLKILQKLDDSDREMLDRYIASCESIEFRLAQLAYRFGIEQKIGNR